MAVPTSDLVVGAVGAIVLVGLIAGLFLVDTGGLGDAPGGDVPDDGTGTSGMDGQGAGSGSGGAMATVTHNFTGTVGPGVYVPAAEDGQAASEEHTFDVPNGTTEIAVTFDFASDTADLDCHLLDSNGTKVGDADCHAGSPGSPQGASFTVSGDALMPGEWTLVVHTSKSSDSPVQVNPDVDYDAAVTLTAPAGAVEMA